MGKATGVSYGDAPRTTIPHAAVTVRQTPSPDLEIEELIAVWRDEDGLSDEAIITVLEAAIDELRGVCRMPRPPIRRAR